MCSLAGVYPSGSIDYGAEIWGNFAPASKIDNSGNVGMLDQSEWTDINISPFIRCRTSKDTTFKAVIDIPLGTLATSDDSSDVSMRVLRGVNITIGGSWNI
jgi:hypothetical protein